MQREERTELEREELVARALGRPVRGQHVPPFVAVEARLRRRPSSAPLVVALLGVVVLALIVGAALAERRTVIAQPGPVPTATASPAPLTWQERLVADTQKVQAPLVYWPLVPTYAPVEVSAQVRTRNDGCGVSIWQCLDYRFESSPGTVVLEVLQGPGGCCLDIARPGAVRNVEIRPGVRAQYIVNQPQFGGPILWWVEDTARGPVYVALNSPVFSEDELIRIASSMRPLPGSPAAASFDPRFARILWMYAPDRQSIVFEQESHAGVLTEMRLVRVADTGVVATFPVRSAQPGEPRVCGTPDVAPAFVGAMPASDDVLQDLRRDGGALRYRLEARTSATDSWFAVQLLDWSKLAGGPCFQ